MFRVLLEQMYSSRVVVISADSESDSNSKDSVGSKDSEGGSKNNGINLMTSGRRFRTSISGHKIDDYATTRNNSQWLGPNFLLNLEDPEEVEQ